MIIYRFDVEYHPWCGYDRLLIHDGGWTDYPVIARLCGSMVGTSYTTTRRRATLQFYTDGYVVKKGFEIDYYFHLGHISESPCLFLSISYRTSLPCSYNTLFIRPIIQSTQKVLYDIVLWYKIYKLYNVYGFHGLKPIIARYNLQVGKTIMIIPLCKILERCFNYYYHKFVKAQSTFKITNKGVDLSAARLILVAQGRSRSVTWVSSFKVHVRVSQHLLTACQRWTEIK